MPAITAEAAKQSWGRTLEAKRREDGRTQADVGAATDLDQKTVSNAERGIGRLEAFVAIANELGVTLFEVPS